MALLEDRTTAFIVRIWCERGDTASLAPEWRGSVEHVQTGQRAFVWDVDGDFRSRSTLEMIDLEPLDEPEDLNLARTEERLIRLALDRTGDHRTEAAKLLGISRRTMQRKLKEMGMVEE